MDKITRSSSRTVTKQSKPIVDVPKSDGSEAKISQFMELNRATVTKFMEQQFDGVGKKEIAEVLRECAECSVLTRSPKSGGCWDKDTDIIEEALKVCKPLAAKPIDDEDEEEEIEDSDDVDSEGDEQEEEDEEIEDDLDSEDIDLDEAEEDDEDDESDEEDVIEEPQEPPRKIDAKKPKKEATAKTKTKTTKKTSPKKVETKESKTKKVQTESSVTIKTGNEKIDKILNTNAFSEADLKGLKGLELWVGAARLLKLKSKIRCQLQDMPEVIGHLYDVHRGKTKLNEDGFEGKGEKSYRKRRLLNIMGAIKQLIGES